MLTNFKTTTSTSVYQLIAKDKTLASEQPFTSKPSKFGMQCISMCDHSPKCLSYAFNGQTCFLYDVMFKTTNGEHRALKDEPGTSYHSTVATNCNDWLALGKRNNGYYAVGTNNNGEQRKEKIFCGLDPVGYIFESKLLRSLAPIHPDSVNNAGQVDSEQNC